jgi:hypothetical protein
MNASFTRPARKKINPIPEIPMPVLCQKTSCPEFIPDTSCKYIVFTNELEIPQLQRKRSGGLRSADGVQVIIKTISKTVSLFRLVGNNIRKYVSYRIFFTE